MQLQGYIDFFARQGLVIIYSLVNFCFMLICCVCLTLQYSAVDSNPLSIYVMHPFWNFVVKVRKLLVSTHPSCRAFVHCAVLCSTVPCQHVVIDSLNIKGLLFVSSQFLPTWLAPNLITFTGFMFLVLNFVMLAFYDFDFNASGKFSSLLEYNSLYLSNEVTQWIIFTL